MNNWLENAEIIEKITAYPGMDESCDFQNDSVDEMAQAVFQFYADHPERREEFLELLQFLARKNYIFARTFKKQSVEPQNFDVCFDDLDLDAIPSDLSEETDIVPFIESDAIPPARLKFTVSFSDTGLHVRLRSVPGLVERGWFTWYISPGRPPLNTHREIDPDLRQNGFSDVFLQLGEFFLASLGFEGMGFFTDSKETACWCLHKGFIPDLEGFDSKDLFSRRNQLFSIFQSLLCPWKGDDRTLEKIYPEKVVFSQKFSLSQPL